MKVRLHALVTAMLLSVVWGAPTPYGQRLLVSEAGQHRVLYEHGEEDLAARASHVVQTMSDAAALKYGTAFQGFRAEVRLHLSDVDAPGRGPYRCCMRNVGEDVTVATIATDYGSLEHNDGDLALATAFMPLAYLATQTERGSAWLFNDAPEWFIEGLPAFDARYHLSDSAESARSSLIHWKQRNARRLECCGSTGRNLFVSDQELGGAAFLAYLAERFGEDVHARILRSHAASFTRAFAEQTRPYTLRQVFDGFVLWE